MLGIWTLQTERAAALPVLDWGVFYSAWLQLWFVRVIVSCLFLILTSAVNRSGLMQLRDVKSDTCYNHCCPEGGAVSLSFCLALAHSACAFGVQVLIMYDNKKFKGIWNHSKSRSVAEGLTHPVLFYSLMKPPVRRWCHQWRIQTWRIQSPLSLGKGGHVCLLLITGEPWTDGGVTLYPLWSLSLQYNSPSSTTALLQLKLRSMMPAVGSYITVLSQSCFTQLN